MLRTSLAMGVTCLFAGCCLNPMNVGTEQGDAGQPTTDAGFNDGGPNACAEAGGRCVTGPGFYDCSGPAPTADQNAACVPTPLNPAGGSCCLRATDGGSADAGCTYSCSGNQWFQSCDNSGGGGTCQSGETCNATGTSCVSQHPATCSSVADCPQGLPNCEGGQCMAGLRATDGGERDAGGPTCYQGCIGDNYWLGDCHGSGGGGSCPSGQACNESGTACVDRNATACASEADCPCGSTCPSGQCRPTGSASANCSCANAGADPFAGGCQPGFFCGPNGFCAQCDGGSCGA